MSLRSTFLVWGRDLRGSAKAYRLMNQIKLITAFGDDPLLSEGRLQARIERARLSRIERSRIGKCRAA